MNVNEKTLVLAFAFTTPPHMPSNVRIARLALKSALGLDQAIFTQADLPVDSLQGLEIARVKEGSGKRPPSTLRIAQEAVKYAQAGGFTSLLVIAAKPHLPRCLRDARLATKGTGITCQFPDEVMKSDYRGWFCRDQIYHRSPGLFWIREKMLIWSPFWLYESVTARY